MIDKSDIQQALDKEFAALRFHSDSRQAVLRRTLGKEEPVMKKKMSVALIFAIALALAAVTALATILVTHSENASRMNLAREALYEKYGFTPTTLGMFMPVGGEENGAYALHWTNNTFHPTLTGVYTTVVRDGKATASWTYDDVDKAVYDSGDLSAPVWGAKQLEAAFADKNAADQYSLALYAKDKQNGIVYEYEEPARLPGPGERLWKNGEILTEAEPGEDALPLEQAYEIAVQALSEDFGIDRALIVSGEIRDEVFMTRENGGTVWEISIWVTIDGVDHDCLVMLDGETGEVLSSDAMTGGNG